MDLARNPLTTTVVVIYEVVRLDGSVLMRHCAPSSMRVRWFPQFPGEMIDGPCAGRYRIDGGDWVVAAYYPDGFPGRQEPWPQGALLP